MSTPVWAQQGIRFVDGSLAAILSIAKERNKNIFIDTYADWCIPCKRMKKKFQDKDVANFFNEHFINYRVNMQNPTRANELRRKYDVVFLPTMYILDPDGIIKYQVDKELTVSELLNAAQQSLDPNSYFVSEATTVRRNDGTLSGGNVNLPPIKKEKPVPSVEKPIDNIQETPPKVTETPKEITKAKTELDKYETIEETKGKVLQVFGAGEMPPQVLRMEAYDKLELMDGSHLKAAKNYLSTQDNWATDENRKFILDFINSTYEKEYVYLVENKTDFVRQFGEQRVQKTLEILTYKTLYNAVPRPDLKQALVLYKNLNVEDPTQQANYYLINRLIDEKNEKEVLKIAHNYLIERDEDHEVRYIVARFLISKTSPTKKQLKTAISLISRAIDNYPTSATYHELLGDGYTKYGRAKKADKAYQKAKKIKKELAAKKRLSKKINP